VRRTPEPAEPPAKERWVQRLIPRLPAASDATNATRSSPAAEAVREVSSFAEIDALLELAGLPEQSQPSGTTAAALAGPEATVDRQLAAPQRPSIRGAVTEARSPYKDTLNLLQTPFAMRANAQQREPELAGLLGGAAASTSG
jgi:hypothetical protein